MSTRLAIVSFLSAVALACGPARPLPDAGVGGSGGVGNIGGSSMGGMTGQGGAPGQGGMSGGQGGTPGAGGSAGQTGGQGGGAGSGQGGGGGSTFAWDGGRSVNAVRGARFCNDLVTLEEVVVTAVESQEFDGGQSSFWIADRTNQRQGMYVFKARSTRTTPYEPKVGDVVTIANASVDTYDSTWDDFGYRRYLRNPCRADAGTMTISSTGTSPLMPTTVADMGFGDSMGGSAAPNTNFYGTLITIPGQRTIINNQPTALVRFAADGGTLASAGFEVTGGILVRTLNQRTDAGLPCAYRNDLDAGIAVSFANGLTGIWDTYTHAPCIGNPACGAARDAGFVPGTTRQTTSVLWLTQCPN